MTLVDLWQSTPEQFVGKQVQQIIGFAGDGILRNQSSGSIEFREFLTVIPSELLAEFGESCLEKSFPNSGYALQDIVNEAGRRLGFEVEAGLYQGNRSDIGFDGLWKLPSGRHIIVEVKTTDAYRMDTATTAAYRHQLIEQDRIEENASSILYVVGRDDTGDLEAQIRGSRHAWDVRLISLKALIRLTILNESLDDPRIVQQISEILVPKEFTRLDHIVDIVFLTAEDTREEPDEIGTIFGDDEIKRSNREPFIRANESAKFNESCSERVAELKNLSLKRRTKTMYESLEGQVHLVSLVSRDYEKAEGGRGSYWYGLRDYHIEFLEKCDEGYLVLGCGTFEEILVIPFRELATWTEQLNSSTKSSGVVHWHIHLYQNDSTFYVEPKRGFNRIDVTRFRI